MDPVAFKLFGHPVHWYGILLAVGFFLAYWVLLRLAPRRKIPNVVIGDILIIAMIGGLLGARLYYVISYWSYYVQISREQNLNPYLRIFFVHEGGLVFFGGFIGAFIGIVLYCWWKRVHVLDVADLAGIGVPLGYAVGRIGCFLNGCCFGLPTTSWIGFSYPASNYPAIREKHVLLGLIHPDAEFCHPIYPVQLFNTAINLFLFGLLLFLFLTRFKNRKGIIFVLFLILTSITRFITEYYRGDYDKDHRYWTDWIPGGLTEAQMFAPWLFFLAILLYFCLPLIDYLFQKRLGDCQR